MCDTEKRAICLVLINLLLRISAEDKTVNSQERESDAVSITLDLRLRDPRLDSQYSPLYLYTSKVNFANRQRHANYNNYYPS